MRDIVSKAGLSISPVNGRATTILLVKFQTHCPPHISIEESTMKKVSISACEGERIGISFPFDAEILDRVKSIKGRRYHNGKEKLWSVSRATEIFRSLLKMSDELKLRGYSRKSSKTYLGHIERLGHWCREDFRKVSVDVLQGYILYLLDDALFTHSYVNQCISTIRFLSYKLLHP